MNQYRTTGQTCRSFGERQVIEQNIVQVFDVFITAIEVKFNFLLYRHQREITINMHSNFRSPAG